MFCTTTRDASASAVCKVIKFSIGFYLLFFFSFSNFLLFIFLGCVHELIWIGSFRLTRNFKLVGRVTQATRIVGLSCRVDFF